MVLSGSKDADGNWMANQNIELCWEGNTASTVGGNPFTLNEIFTDKNAREVWRLWGFDSTTGAKWTLKKFTMTFNAPRIFTVPAAPEVIVGTDPSTGHSDGVSLRSLLATVREAPATDADPSAAPSPSLPIGSQSAWKLYHPGPNSPLHFTTADLSDDNNNLLDSPPFQALNGVPLAGNWQLARGGNIYHPDNSTIYDATQILLHGFELNFIVPPGVGTGVQPYPTEGNTEYVSQRIVLGSGVPLEEGLHPEDDIVTVSVTSPTHTSKKAPAQNRRRTTDMNSIGPPHPPRNTCWSPSFKSRSRSTFPIT